MEENKLLDVDWMFQIVKELYEKIGDTVSVLPDEEQDNGKAYLLNKFIVFIKQELGYGNDVNGLVDLFDTLINNHIQNDDKIEFALNLSIMLLGIVIEYKHTNLLAQNAQVIPSALDNLTDIDTNND